jgi:hypothetical protein
MRPQGPTTPFALRGVRFTLAGALALAMTAGIAHAQAAKPATPAAKPAAAAAATPAPAARAELEDLRLGFLLFEQVDRLNPGSASQLNTVSTGSIAVGADFDYKVMALPLGKKGSNPFLAFAGRILASSRAVAESVPIVGDTTGRDTLQLVPDARAVELTGSIRLAYPVYARGKEVLTNAYFKAEVSSIFVTETRNGLLDVRTYAIGFERASGQFAGSFVDLGYGRDGTFGAFSGERYKVHVLIIGAISPATSGKRGNFSTFAELELSSDNKGGPDGLRVQVGARLDSDGVLKGVSGLIGGILGT